MDKSAKTTMVPKGVAYCNTKGTSCFYGEGDVCVNCKRKKGWRQIEKYRKLVTKGANND